MADPDMEFVIDSKAHTLSARTYQQDSLGVYQKVEMDNDLVLNPELEEELDDASEELSVSSGGR